MERRIISLEEEVALQGKTIDDLSDVMADQQRQMDRMERMMKAMAAKLQAMHDPSDYTSGSDDEVPPHY